MDEIINGDAYELIKGIPDRSVDLIVTDPPYEFGSNHGSGIFKTKMKGSTTYDEITANGLDKGIDAGRILPELKRVMKRTNIYIWCNKDQIKAYLDFFLGCNFEVIIWGKSNPPPFVGGHYLKDKEYCLYFWERGVKNHITCERGRTVYMGKTNVEDKKSYGHPTIKPLPIIENLILNSSDRGGGGPRPILRERDHMRGGEGARAPLHRLRDRQALLGDKPIEAGRGEGDTEGRRGGHRADDVHMTVCAEEVQKAYEAMRSAPNYTSYKDRKRHYERLLRKARREEGWKRDK